MITDYLTKSIKDFLQETLKSYLPAPGWWKEYYKSYRSDEDCDSLILEDLLNKVLFLRRWDD